MKTIRVIGLAWLFALLLPSCTPGFPIQTLKSLDSLPNSVSIPLPNDKARMMLLQYLQVAPERDDPFNRKFGFHSANYLYMNSDLYSADAPAYFHAEGKGNAAFGSRFFSDPRNANDLYVGSMGEDVVSSYYHTINGPLGYLAEFALTLKPKDANNTTITVRSFNSTVANGKEFNLHVLGMIPRSVAVAPSRAEEYRLLVYVAHVLGVEIPTLDAEVKRLATSTN
jgi:hypothetical protein